MARDPRISGDRYLDPGMVAVLPYCDAAFGDFSTARSMCKGASMGNGVRLDSGLRGTRASGPPPALAGRRILYVDDDEFLRRLSVRMLGGAGALCLTAGTHADALAIVAREPALDLAILDYQMPDGDIGLLVGRLCTLRPGLRLIGNSSEDRSFEFSAHGVTSFLEKPWKLDALVQAMRD